MVITNENIHDLVQTYVTHPNNLPEELKNKKIGEWDVSRVSNFSRLFKDLTHFNEPLNDWDVSSATNMAEMFVSCQWFDQPLNKWDVGKVTDMGGMFFECQGFNQPLHKWDVSKVTDMGIMFYQCSEFNQPLNNWNVGKVKFMESMFMNCFDFDQPLNRWNVSKVQNMDDMFNGCESFDQPLNDWDVSNVIDMEDIFENCKIQERYKPAKFRSETTREERKEFHSVKKRPIPLYHEKHHLSIDRLKTQQAFDVIMREDTFIWKHLTESTDHIVFYHPHGTGGHFYITDKNTLEHLATDVNSVKYKCNQVYEILYISPDKYDAATPYLAGKSFGFYGLIPIAQLKTIIESADAGHQFILVKESGKAPSTVSMQMLGEHANAVSASHCQEGHGDTIYELHRIHWKDLPFHKTLSKTKPRFTRSLSIAKKNSKTRFAKKNSKTRSLSVKNSKNRSHRNLSAST